MIYTRHNPGKRALSIHDRVNPGSPGSAPANLLAAYDVGDAMGSNGDFWSPGGDGSIFHSGGEMILDPVPMVLEGDPRVFVVVALPFSTDARRPLRYEYDVTVGTLYLRVSATAMLGSDLLDTPVSPSGFGSSLIYVPGGTTTLHFTIEARDGVIGRIADIRLFTV